MANTTPIFVLTPNFSTAASAAANTASDGSGALVTLFTAGTNGSLITSIKASNAQIAALLSSSMVVRVFVTDTIGANPRLVSEAALPAATRSLTAVGATVTINFLGGLQLAAGQIVKVCQSVYAGVQDLTHFSAQGGDY